MKHGGISCRPFTTRWNNFRLSKTHINRWNCLRGQRTWRKYVLSIFRKVLWSACSSAISCNMSQETWGSTNGEGLLIQNELCAARWRPGSLISSLGICNAEIIAERSGEYCPRTESMGKRRYQECGEAVHELRMCPNQKCQVVILTLRCRSQHRE